MITDDFTTASSTGDFSVYPNAEEVSTRDCAPCAYRLARKPDGTLILQGRFRWTRGSVFGYEWADLETADVPE